MDNEYIYADYSATTPIREDVLDAMLPFLKWNFGNPSSQYKLGVIAKESIKLARERVASVINADPDEIYFTSCGSEADNWAIKSIAKKYVGQPIYVSSIEHPAIINTCASIDETQIYYLPVDSVGKVQIPWEEVIFNKPSMISVMAANNEIGTVEPYWEIGKKCRENGILFHTDAVQVFGKLPIDVKAMCIDMLSISGHKIGAPKGIGALYIRKGIDIDPLINGGEQESGMRAGTENVASIVGFGVASLLAKEELEEEANRLTFLGSYLIDSALEIPGVHLTGDKGLRIPGHCSFIVDQVEGEALQTLLNLDDIYVSTGSACSSGYGIPSHVLSACG